MLIEIRDTDNIKSDFRETAEEWEDTFQMYKILPSYGDLVYDAKGREYRVVGRNFQRDGVIIFVSKKLL